jgi:DNA-binding MarR family transcriptional regulator
MFRKEDSLGYLVNHMARLMEHGLNRRIRPLGLTTGVFPVLLELWEEDGLTQKQLVERLDIEQPTMSNTLARMERDGLVQRRQDTGDLRSRRVWLTDTATRLREPALAEATAENASVLAALTDAEQEHLLTLCRKIIGTKRR